MFSYNLIACISSVQMATYYFLCVWPNTLWITFIFLLLSKMTRVRNKIFDLFILHLWKSLFMFFRGHLYLNITFWRIHWSDQECLQSVKLWHCRDPYKLKPSSHPHLWHQNDLRNNRNIICCQSCLLAFSFFTSVLCILPHPHPPFFAILVLDQMMMITGVALTGEPSLKAAVGGSRLLHLALESCAGVTELHALMRWWKILTHCPSNSLLHLPVQITQAFHDS